jgi:hypothetical protein
LAHDVEFRGAPAPFSYPNQQATRHTYPKVICALGESAMPTKKPIVAVTNRELLDAIMRDLRAIYVDVIRQPLPPALAAALVRLETRAHEEPARLDAPTQDALYAL